MGERGVRNAEVRGSIPLISTISIKINACRRYHLTISPSKDAADDRRT